MPVSIKGTGGGSVTLSAAAAATDTTLTLPNVTGTVLQSGTAVTVAQGGTGAATLAANNVLLGNGTSAVQTVAPGTSGNVLTSNGTAWTSAAPAASGGFSNMQVFTSTGTFTVPAGVTKVKVTVVGGGGAGGGATQASCLFSGGAGGGGGGASIKVISGLTPGGTITATVGLGGTGNTGTGGAGGTSSFGAYCSATGCGAGVGGLNVTQGAAGAGGAGSGGDANITGSTGGFYASNYGGASFMGGASRAIVALGYASSISGDSGKNYGGGGGGSYTGTSSATGGSGAAGIIVVEY